VSTTTARPHKARNKMETDMPKAQTSDDLEKARAFI
jgi:hypothetical protein